MVYADKPFDKLQNSDSEDISGTAEGEGLVGPQPHHFLAPPPPLFALKSKLIKIKKRLETSFFPSIFRYILCIFFNFKRQAFCGAPVLFAVIVSVGPTFPLIKRHALATPSLRSAACFVLPFRAEFFLSVLSDEMKKTTSFFKPNEAE